MENMEDEMDEFGNLWVLDLPTRSEISPRVFSNRFVNYSTIVVGCIDDKIYAAGNSREALEKGFLSRGLNPNDYQLEPGPFKNIPLNQIVD